jgi:O-antigen/teichoic acid export membrane protein
MTSEVAADKSSADVLRTPRAGALVIRGGALRALGYAVAAILGAATSVFLLRGLGVEDFGRYATVAALLGIVSTLSDAGLVAVGARELAVRAAGPERERLLENLVALRIVLTVAALGGALVFAAAASYDSVLVGGLLLGGAGVLLVNTQSTMMLPLSVELRVGTITAVEIAKSTVTLASIAALALVGASLLPYFAVQILAGAVVLGVTPRLLGSSAGLRPRLRRAEARGLLRDAAPVAVALAMNVLYLRLLVVLVSLETGARETGLYGTAFRVVELFVVMPPVLVGIAIPLLAVAGAEDLARLRYGLQGLAEIVTVASLGLALVVAVLAEPALRLLGGVEYEGATTLLQIQIWALVPLAVGSVVSLGLLSLRRQRDIALANALAVAIVLLAGYPLIVAYGGKGAAVAGVVAEAALVAALLALLWLAERAAVPRFWFVPRPLVAVAAGSATLLVPLPDWVDGAVAGVVFVVVALAVRAVPREVVEALLRRAPGDRA